jgi:hypothetical protein
MLRNHVKRFLKKSEKGKNLFSVILSCQQVVSLSQSSCGSSVELTARRGL